MSAATLLSTAKKEYAAGAPNATVYLSTAAIVCKTGYKWADGTTSSRIMLCNEFGQWNHSISCLGLFPLYFLWSVLFYLSYR